MIKEAMKENETVKPNSREMAVLKEHFASCFNSDGTFDLEKFKAKLGEDVFISNEGYELDFLGKNYARLLAALDTTTVVVPDEKHNAKPENANSQNVYISGDNLDALKLLKKSYAGKVKCIYIDPPYNTGSDGFVYNDSFNFTAAELAAKLNLDEEKAQRILTFTKRGSASHSAWLMYMLPRLLLAKDLLSETGMIFVSIDDNEVSNLKLLLDSLFHEERFVGQVSIVSNPRGRDYGGVAKIHEYMLVYKNTDETDIALVTDENSDFTMKDELGGFELRELRNRNVKFNKENRPNLYYPFYVNPKSVDDNGLLEISLDPEKDWVELWPKPSQGIDVVWRWSKEKAKANLNKEIAGKEKRNGGFMIVEKYRESKKMARSIWADKTTNTERGTLEVKALFDDKKVFDYPKPVDMLCKVLEMATGDDDEFIVVDFFSGSGSMAHAVLEQNARDVAKINRHFILVQIQEACKPKSIAFKEGYKTIDEIGQARITKAAAKIAKENPIFAKTLDLGFKHYTLKEPSAEQLEKIETFDPVANSLLATEDMLKEFGVQTVLATWMVRDGYGLTAEAMPVDFDGYTAWWMDKHLYLIGAGLSDKGIIRLVEKYETDGCFNPVNVVVFGYSFAWTTMEGLKANLAKLRDGAKSLPINIDIRY